MLYGVAFIFIFTVGGLSGVLLSNAALDIAFHDRNLESEGYLKRLLNKEILKKRYVSKEIEYLGENLIKDYIKKYFVGLFEGDGSIQVNHWRKKNLQYRLVIKLKNLESNNNMLRLIAKVLKGKVLIDKKSNNVLWVMNDKKEIIKLISNVFDKYEFLTLKKRYDLAFMKYCLKHTDVNNYLVNRNNKYLLKLYRSDLELYRYLIKKINVYYLNNINYFNEWLSGFIEAEGCFSIRLNNNIQSFSISQKNEEYLITYISDRTPRRGGSLIGLVNINQN